MRSITDLPEDELQVAHDAAETLLRFRAYLPFGAMLPMLAGRWRDDIRDLLGLKRDELPHRGKEHRPLDELTSTELGTLADAVTTLLEVRFTSAMDDPALPKLLRDLANSLDTQSTEREQLQASIGAS